MIAMTALTNHRAAPLPPAPLSPCAGYAAREPRAIVHIVDFDAVTIARITQLLAASDLAARVHADAGAFDEDESDMPGCILINARHGFPGPSILFERLNAELPKVVAADDADTRTVVSAMKAGAVDFLEKPLRERELLAAIEAAIGIDRERRRCDAGRDALRARFAGLSPRERQVMALVTQGLLNKQVAGDLGLSEVTVKVHRGSAMRKMGARTLADLVRMADAVGD
jgi:FixJ family two-component response regulator